MICDFFLPDDKSKSTKSETRLSSVLRIFFGNVMKFFLERENGWVERRWQLFWGVAVGRSVGRFGFLCVVPLLSGRVGYTFVCAF